MDGISILIVNYNGEKYIYETVVTIAEQLSIFHIDYEILILDNKSIDISLLLIEELKDKYKDIVSCVESAENLGFGKGNNILIKKAKYRNIFLLNNDTKTISLEKILHYIKNRKLQNNQILTSRIYNEDMTIQKNWFSVPNLFKLVLELFLCKHFINKFLYPIAKRKGILKSDLETICFSGCFLAMTRDLYDKIGGFDESFLFYHEECDFFMRARKYNVSKIILEDSIVHYGGGGGEVSNFAFVNYYTSLFILYLKHNLISKRKLLMMFKVSFSIRILLLQIGTLIPYSPFENLYLKQKNTRSKKEIIVLHKDTLKSIIETSRKLKLSY